MRRKILLSVVVSAWIMAGGDIAPVNSSAPASADFWGQVGFAYQFQDEDWKTTSGDLGDRENNAFSATVVLGVEKELGRGFGFGAELAGWSDFGLNIADSPRVEADGDMTAAELSRAYLTYTFGNTAVKAGRQALPETVSPWAWSDRSVGVVDWSYDGIVVTNTDWQESTLIGAWIPHAYHNTVEQRRISGSSGLFMLGVVNTSLSDTAVTINGYYLPESELLAIRGNKIGKAVGREKTWSLWGSSTGSFGGVDLGIQLAYSDGSAPGWDATYGVAAKIGSKWGAFDAELIAGYINGGDYSLAGAGGGTAVEDSAFWTDTYDVSGDSYGAKQWSLQSRMNYRLPTGYGRLYGILGYWDFGRHAEWGDEKSAWNLRAGYRFELLGTDTKVEYRYRTFRYYHSGDRTRQRVRIEAYYRF
jgi:hypothetical protein